MQAKKTIAYLLATGALILLGACGGGDKIPPPKVTVEPVKRQDVTESKTYIATIESVSTIDIVPRVEGFLIEQYFDGGDDVEAGQLLFKIQQEEYIANLKQAKADLYSAQATLTNNTLTLKRMKDLAEKNFASQSDEDKAQADYETALGQVEAAEAELINAELNLSYTEIMSPINGRIGFPKVFVGDLLAPRSGVITTVVQLDPIRAVFSMSENDLLSLKLDNPGKTQKQLKASFTPKIKFQNGEKYPIEGVVESMDNTINPGTGSITVRTLFENPDAILLPGQFVNVELRKGEPRYSLTVPAGAVLYDKTGYYVLAVNEEDVVEVKYIKEGVKNNKFVEVVSGLSEGEHIITGGMQKAQPGVKVNPISEAKPKTDSKQQQNSEKNKRERKHE